MISPRSDYHPFSGQNDTIGTTFRTRGDGYEEECAGFGVGWGVLSAVERVPVSFAV
jgi:hypothetical protein